MLGKTLFILSLVVLLILGAWAFTLRQRAARLQGEVSQLKDERAAIARCVSSLSRRSAGLEKSHTDLKIALMKLQPRNCDADNLMELNVYADVVNDAARDVARSADGLGDALTSERFDEAGCW
jgi:predicted  nucleic acid-binding Zn-ribbon protein